MSEQEIKLKLVLLKFIQDIESTGGVINLNDGTVMPAGDPEWLDIAQTYLDVCDVLGHKPMIEYSDEPLTVYRDEE